MKQLHLIAGLSLTILMGACSQQRYAHIPKVKVNEQAEAKTVKPKKEVRQEPARDFVLNTQTEEAKPFEAQSPETVVPVTPATEKAVKEKLPARVARNIEKKINKVIDRIPQEQILKMVVPSKVTKPDQTTDQDATKEVAEHWLKIIIIGFILVLIGWLVGGPIGSIFYIVGSVIMVVGLIFLLLSIL